MQQSASEPERGERQQRGPRAIRKCGGKSLKIGKGCIPPHPKAQEKTAHIRHEPVGRLAVMLPAPFAPEDMLDRVRKSTAQHAQKRDEKGPCRRHKNRKCRYSMSIARHEGIIADARAKVQEYVRSDNAFAGPRKYVRIKKYITASREGCKRC